MFQTGGVIIKKRYLMALLASVCIFAPAAAQARSYDVDIPEQSLAGSLLKISKVTGLQLVFSDTTITKMRSRRLKGTFTVEQMLSQLLLSSGYDYTINGNIIRVYHPDKPMTRKISASAGLVQGMPEASHEPGPEPEPAPIEGDIVVTAQRTQSLASKTPITMNAISGDALLKAGVTNPTTLGDQVPNVSIVRSFGLQITIRGVTNGDNGEKGDPSAAFLLDGIYIARPQVQEVSFYDVARVEVLRGPQGTLYGRNTTAGVINVIANTPSDKLEAAANIGYGNYDTRQADAMINVPVNDAIALRFSGSYDRRDSYIISNPGDPFDQNPFKDNISGRAQARFKIGSDATLLLRGDYSRMNGNGNTVTSVLGQNFFADPDVGGSSGADPVYTGGSSKALRTRGYDLLAEPRFRNSTWGVSADLQWNVGFADIAYLGSYRRFDQYEDATDYAGGAIRQILDGKYWQHSQELRFAFNPVEKLKLQVGGYYFREENDLVLSLPDYFGLDLFQANYHPTIGQSIGTFAQGTYSLTDALRFTAGVRYTWDKKSHFGETIIRSGPVFDAAAGDSILLNAATVKSQRATWRLGLDYDLNSRTLLYAVVSSGYKSGGFNDGCQEGLTIKGVYCNNPRPASQLYYKPETLTAYELGIKGRLPDNSVRFAASAFYYDYRNLQLSTIAEYAGTPAPLVQNAGKAAIKGVEVETTLVPSARNHIDLSFTYLDAKYKHYFPLGAGNEPDYDGRPLDRSPKTTASVSYTYSYPLKSGGSIDLNLRSKLSAAYYVSILTIPQQLRQPSYTRTDVTLTYNAPMERWYLQGYVRNIENNVLITAASNFGGTIIAPGDPLTFGFRTGVKF